jgi:hypothetical protein
MSKLAEYIEEVVEPTFIEFEGGSTPLRAFLAAVATYHAIDRAAEDLGRRSPANLRKEWGDKSMAFKLVDVAAHHFKHVKSDDEDKKPEQWNGMLSFGDVLHHTTAIQFRSTMIDAIKFLREEAARPLKLAKPHGPSAQ